jgi:hypothetical protein
VDRGLAAVGDRRLYGSRSTIGGLAMGSRLIAVALLLNHKRITDSGTQGARFTSLTLAVIAGLALVLLHFVVGPAMNS